MSSRNDTGNRRNVRYQPAENQGSIWDGAGLTTALIPLIGSGALFMAGWSYLSNWYSYYGVSVSQVNIQPQDVVIQSVPALVVFLSCFLPSILAYMVFTTFYKILQGLIRIAKREEPRPHSGQIYKPFNTMDWAYVFGITTVALLTLYEFGYSSSVIQKTGIFSLYLYETFYWVYSLAIVQIGGMIIAGGLAIYGLGIGIIEVIFFFQKRSKAVKRKQVVEEKVPQAVVWLFLELFFIVIALLALSAAFAINDASIGIRTGGFSVQAVFVVSPSQPDMNNLSCDEKYCTTGPYLLIGENDNAYLLVNLETPDNTGALIKYNPGVYIVPRTDETYLVPSLP